MLKSKEITLKVPATTGNVGSGFDCIGLAVDIWNSLSISFNSDNLIIENTGVSKDSYDSIKVEDNLIITGILEAYPKFDISKIKIFSENQIPYSNGLGSSAAALCSGLLIGNYLNENKFSLEDLNEKAIRIEGHPDNVTPCLFGGLTISVFDDVNNKWIVRKINTPKELNIMIFTPDFISNTNTSRKKLSKSVSRLSAVYNISRVALLIDSLHRNDLTLFNQATKDSLHQDTRLQDFPEMKSIMNAAIEGGALGTIVSGSGPSIMIFSNGNEFTIDYEIKEAARKHNLEGNTIITKPSNQGILLSK
ncbi:MAG: homoserine kinase [Chloroflexi bacterium]|nr:homoserine kinase [Chloroflexota bacterium]|tara:strand:- start:11134 stop:12051 length:918 start_codon:yes stop_codon:yes gene_type:complete